ncbi:hypothetical protein [Paenarthrobacter ureafaciens]|uniref:hypothetical protein n=1 Tax=Paenarthrobacter ureafaciens TaxID=37931 RepID=UPI001A99E660|nr:hypothetical protein [Paenarthrobacter ureafaciens]QSZ55591.1 hypothetical protein AYX19_21070 [Paenarthrobacter ureafaciens]
MHDVQLGLGRALNPDGFELAEAMTEYETQRGPVPYPDRPSLSALVSGSVERPDLAGLWFVQNPHA